MRICSCVTFLLIRNERTWVSLKEFSDAGAIWELHAYGHTMHAFTFKGANFPERGIAHNPVADKRSWDAAVIFLRERLANGDGTRHPENEGQ